MKIQRLVETEHGCSGSFGRMDLRVSFRRSRIQVGLQRQPRQSIGSSRVYARPPCIGDFPVVVRFYRPSLTSVYDEVISIAGLRVRNTGHFDARARRFLELPREPEASYRYEFDG
jgi:hypothetical protein